MDSLRLFPLEQWRDHHKVHRLLNLPKLWHNHLLVLWLDLLVVCHLHKDRHLRAAPWALKGDLQEFHHRTSPRLLHNKGNSQILHQHPRATW